jgi:hypothetical protein
MRLSIPDWVTTLVNIPAVISIILVIAFCYQEIAIHTVDTDLKLLTFSVVGYWFGGVTMLHTVKQSIKGVIDDKPE